MDSVTRTVTWGEFVIGLLQIVGAVVGCAVAAALLFYAVVSFGKGIVRLSSRMSPRAAKLLRRSVMACILVIPPVATYIGLASSLRPFTNYVAIPFSLVVLGGCMGMWGVITTIVRDAPKESASDKSSGH